MRYFFIVKILIAFALVIILASLVTDSSAQKPIIGRVEVSTNSANIRAEPDKESRIVGSAKPGDRFDMLAEEKGWIRVALSGGRQGWIFGKLVTPLSESQAPLTQKEIMANKSFDRLRAGNLAYLSGRLPEAISEFTAAIEANPDNAAAYYNLAVAYQDTAKYDDAATAYKKAIELNPANVRARLNLGVLYYEQKRFEEAANEFDKAIEASPNNVRAIYNLALVLERTDKSKAAQKWEKYIELAAGDSEQAKWVEKAQQKLKSLKESSKK